MNDSVYIPELDTYGFVERYWHDKSMVYVTPFGSRYGQWFLPHQVQEVRDLSDYQAALWMLEDND